MPAFLTFDSSEVCDLVGIGPLLLNKFVERRTYGIQPSVRTGKGRGGRRLFSPDDVLGIALVWWLFESGLRSNVIQIVLDGICRGKASTADQAAKRLIKTKTGVVQIRINPRREHRGLSVPRHLVFLITEEKEYVSGSSIAMGISVGDLYSILVKKMKKLTGLPEEG